MQTHTHYDTLASDIIYTLEDKVRTREQIWNAIHEYHRKKLFSDFFFNRYAMIFIGLTTALDA